MQSFLAESDGLVNLSRFEESKLLRSNGSREDRSKAICNGLRYDFIEAVTQGYGPVVIKGRRGIRFWDERYKSRVDGMIYRTRSPALLNHPQQILSQNIKEG